MDLWVRVRTRTSPRQSSGRITLGWPSYLGSSFNSICRLLKGVKSSEAGGNFCRRVVNELWSKPVMVMKAWSTWDANNFYHGDSGRDSKEDLGMCLQQQWHSPANRDLQNAFSNLECLQDWPPFLFKLTLRSKNHCQSCIICQLWVVSCYVTCFVTCSIFLWLKIGRPNCWDPQEWVLMQSTLTTSSTWPEHYPVACTATYTVNPQATGHLPEPRIPLYNNLKRLLLDVSKLVLVLLSLCRLM